ncbi:MAG TPA: hypothetical protein VD966_04780 [Pyrinomonadaceae bacterium]|nr:hypothetical protein [Pyrinomonadaceae bacterium]
MRNNVLIFVLALLLTRSIAAAQEGRTLQLVVALRSEGFVAFKTETMPTEASPKSSFNSLEIQPIINPQAHVDDNNVIHRVLVDHEGNFIFGYDLAVEPVASSKQFKVSIRPLGPEFERQLRAGPASQTQRAQAMQNIHTLPRSADVQIIDDGDAFALDLLVNRETGVKIVDVVKVSFDRSRLLEVPFSPPRDFTLDNVEMAVKDYRLLMDGKLIGGGRATSGCAGALVWVYVPDHGRFIFSLMPREGYHFQKAGVIEDNKILFNAGGKHYEWVSSSPIVGRGGAWNLWVLLDPTYVPDFVLSAEIPVNGDKQNSPPGTTTRWSPFKGALPTTSQGKSLEFKTDPSRRSAKAPEHERKRARVMIGAADRIENLLPR